MALIAQVKNPSNKLINVSPPAALVYLNGKLFKLKNENIKNDSY